MNNHEPFIPHYIHEEYTVERGDREEMTTVYDKQDRPWRVTKLNGRVVSCTLANSQDVRDEELSKRLTEIERRLDELERKQP